MKILIVGGAGYLGGYMSDYLSLNGHQITVYDILLYETRYIKNIDFIYGDIRDTDKLLSIIHEFDCVIWLAGLVGDGASAVDPELTRVLNTNSVKWLVDNYNGKIVFPSTCSVYGKNDNILDEESPTSPLSVYAHTKLQAEEYLLSKRPDSLVFRLGTLFGIGDEHSRLRTDLVANLLTIKATRGEPLTVFGGEQNRPLLHVRDVSTAVQYALQLDVSGLYNLSYKNYNLAEMANEIASYIPGSRVILSELAFEDQRNYRVDNSKFASTGWKPTYTLEFGVRQVSKIIKESRIKDLSDPRYSNAAYMKQQGTF